ncbi:MAG: deoxyribodipyrimidine photo-lyase [Rhodoferax sp.]
MWFRRDLRVTDNATLHQALSQSRRVWCVFVFDTDILEHLPRADRRVEFIHASVQALAQALRALAPGGQAALIVRVGSARVEVPALAQALGVGAVFAGHDDEPAARARDAAVAQALAPLGAVLHTVKDHVIFAGRELLTQQGRVYGVFTPYKNAWLARLQPQDVADYDVRPLALRLAAPPPGFQGSCPSLADLGFARTNLSQMALPAGEAGAATLLHDFVSRLDDYGARRDYPALKGPSYLGVHLRFGTVSIRRLVALAHQRQLAGSVGAAVWLGELVWRDFYAMILANHPHVVTQAYKPEYDRIAWAGGPDAEALFAAWCAGQTGYPLVDAAMAQINQSGYMHNRLRMVVGSFLVKDLGLDWRWGEAYFAQHLNDFELASNNGGWQWVASSGCDAQPFFRIFNPVSQSEKFDPQGRFIRRYLPQLAGLSDKRIHAPWTASAAELQAANVRLGHNYPLPIVQHDAARQATLARYAVVAKPGPLPAR